MSHWLLLASALPCCWSGSTCIPCCAIAHHVCAGAGTPGDLAAPGAACQPATTSVGSSGEGGRMLVSTVGIALLASIPHWQLCWSRPRPLGVLSSGGWKGDSAPQPASGSHGGGLDSHAVCGDSPLQVPAARAAVRTIRAFTFLAGSTFLERVHEWPFNTALHYPCPLNCHFSTQTSDLV